MGEMKMADCSKLSDFFDEAARLCGCYNSDCNKLCQFFPHDCLMITVDQKGYFMDLAKKVQEWSDEHPVTETKTYADDFFEKFPNAPKEKDGTPMCCRASVYGDGSCDERYTGLGYENECIPCWNEPYEKMDSVTGTV